MYEIHTNQDHNSLLFANSKLMKRDYNNLKP
jgi:hypothetical protein